MKNAGNLLLIAVGGYIAYSIFFKKKPVTQAVVTTIKNPVTNEDEKVIIPVTATPQQATVTPTPPIIPAGTAAVIVKPLALQKPALTTTAAASPVTPVTPVTSEIRLLQQRQSQSGPYIFS